MFSTEAEAGSSAGFSESFSLEHPELERATMADTGTAVAKNKTHIKKAAFFIFFILSPLISTESVYNAIP